MRTQVAAAVQRIHRISAGRNNIELVAAVPAGESGAADLAGNPHGDARRAVAAIRLKHPANDAAKRLQPHRHTYRGPHRHPAGSSATKSGRRVGRRHIETASKDAAESYNAIGRSYPRLAAAKLAGAAHIDLRVMHQIACPVAHRHHHRPLPVQRDVGCAHLVLRGERRAHPPTVARRRIIRIHRIAAQRQKVEAVSAKSIRVSAQAGR